MAPAELATQARLISLLRLLLLALGLGVMTFFATTRGAGAVEALKGASWLLVAMCVAAAAMAATVGWVRQRWQLALHLGLDLCWAAGLLYLTGGVASPGIVLLFAVVLISNLALPGYVRLLFPVLGSLALGMVALCYLGGITPFPADWIVRNPAVIDHGRILGDLAVQVIALFLVDLLGHLLARRLSEQRIFTGQVLDQLGEGVLAVDRQGHVAYCNAEAVRLLGLGEAPRHGQAASQILATPALAPVGAQLAALRVPSLERWRGPSGRELVLRVNQLTGRRGLALGRTLVIADETRLRTLEDNARRAEALAALGEMAAGIAHEVRNPLTSLRGCAQELAVITAADGREDGRRLAEIIIAESDRMARIVGDFLALSRMRPAQRSELEVPALVDEAGRLAAASADRPGRLQVEAVAVEGCPMILADADQMRQVLANLVRNALEAMRDTALPRLAIHAEPAGDDNPLPVPAVRLTVEDNGCGIALADQERVFTPFWSSKPQGTGLGLSLVSRILREHEGLLRLDSAPGRGTAAIVYLPTASQTRAFRRALGGG